MKSILNYLCLACLLAVAGCNDAFMDRFPRHSVTQEDFFKTVEDLKTYTNGFYAYLDIRLDDGVCDNVSVYGGSRSDLSQMIYGGLTPDNVSAGVWDWSAIRNVNYFLTYASGAEGPEEEINHYIGFGRLMRAYLYYEKVKMFGDVPWYDRPLTDADTEELYKTQDSRVFVVDKIMEDLDFAVKNMQPAEDRTMFGVWAARTLQARIALHEGTFRKYHGIEGADDFLKVAEEASGDVLANGGFSLHSENYQSLFNSQELKDNSEMILFREHTAALSKFTAYNVLDLNWGLSRDLVDSYLMLDGTPFTSLPGNETMTFDKQFENRDLRLTQTSVYPGWIDIKFGVPYLCKPPYGGYGQIKFYPDTPEQCFYYACVSDIPLLRLGEVMLIYAEAKAELGTLTDEDLNNTVNLLRRRGGIEVPLTRESANGTIDPVLEQMYPNVSGANKGVILEIRRERRVELACEGFRYDDLMRWKCGELMARPGEGMYVPALGAYDVTGDGVLDIAILNEASDKGPIADLPEEVQNSLIIHALKDENGDATFYLEHGDSGRIRFRQDRDGTRAWKDQYYYYPIPQEQIRLNPNLKQPSTW